MHTYIHMHTCIHAYTCMHAYTNNTYVHTSIRCRVSKANAASAMGKEDFHRSRALYRTSFSIVATRSL